MHNGSSSSRSSERAALRPRDLTDGLGANERHAALRRATASRSRFLLWVDGVGGYLVCLSDRVALGQPTEQSIDVPILGDVSRLHAWIERMGDGYVVRPCRATSVGGRPVIDRAPLADRDVIELGPFVRLTFRQPSALSATARLELAAPQRLPLAVDAVLLMADTCILGPEPSSHVVAPDWKAPVVLFRRGEELWCRGPGELEIDGQTVQERGRVTLTSRIIGEGFSLALEPVVSSGRRL